MALWFEFSECDICSWILVALPLVLLSVLCVCRFIRWWNMQPTNKCPRCRVWPAAVHVYNVCASCGCEYDKWGCILKDAMRPPLDALDLARFTPQQSTPDHREGSPEFKPGGEVRE